MEYNYKNTRTKPIAIPRSPNSNANFDFNNVEYCLKENHFNPNKCSPPNSWNERLMQRLASSYENEREKLN